MKRETFVSEFRRAAARWGDAPAILSEGRTAFTYAGLLRRAEELARGLKPGSVVGLRMPKSPEYIASMLGAWLAEAAFIPLDPALPRERLALMSKEARRAPEGLAYVIYTSGSTGAPKGVMVGHGGILGLLRAQIKAFGLRPGCRSLWHHSTSFDASISDIGTALLSGAALCLERPGAKIPSGITHMDVPPSLLSRLDPAVMPSSLETVIIGGEVCPPAVVRRWARSFRVVNVYGPTEATVCASLRVCSPRWTRPLIGRPLPGVIFHVLDRDLKAVRRGELCIGGNGLARGYLGRPELTAEKFIIRGGDRLYRTGDLVARRGKDFEFLGRLDRQIKLRGLRIEPGEIEAALLSHPGVRSAAVVKRRGQLTAIVTGDVTARALRRRLARRLPRWMLPQRFERSGRLDETARERGPARLLVEAWKDALGISKVGLKDEFHALGGDSLSALAAVAAAEERGLRVAPSWMSEGVTIESLVRKMTERPAIDARKASELREDVPRIGFTAPARAANPPARLLLTGTTGFLGSRLLHELLRQSRARVACLVRAQDAAQGRRRVGEALARHGLRLTGRVSVLCGDIDEPRLGLDRGVWDELARGLDSVYHCAANVNLTLPYEALRRTNVEGTREALRLAREGRPKSFHYASTLSVFVATDRNTGEMREDDELDKTRHVYGGYAQSKWAAEVMLRASGVPFHCYRFGLITGDTRTGYGPPDDLLSLFVRGAAALGRVPRLPAHRLKVDITPVDYAAAAMARLSLTAEAGTFHIANPRGLSLRGLLDAMRAHGVALTRVPGRSWRGASQSAAFLSFKSRLPGAFERLRPLDLFQATGARFLMDRTRRGLSGSGLSCPPPDARLVGKYVRHILGAPR